MSFGIKTSNIKSIVNYEHADLYFKNTLKPRTARWRENQRPLRDTRSTHLRIEVGVENDLRYYDLCLYNTSLIRYYQPNDKGEHAVYLSYYDTNSSFAFMGTHGWWAGKNLATTDGRKIDMPFVHDKHTARQLFNDEFTMRLIFDSQGRLDTNKSVHVPMFKQSSSATLRAKRKAFKDRLSMVLDLVDMQYNRILSEADVDIYAGQPGSSSNNNTFTRNFLTEEQVDAFRYDAEWSPEVVTGLVQLSFSYAEDAFNSMMNRRAYIMDGGSRWGRKYREQKVTDGDPLASQTEDVREAITPSQDEVRKGVLNRLIGLALLNGSDAQKPYPEFPMPLPREFYRFRAKQEGTTVSLEDVLDKGYYEKLVNRKGVVYP